MVRHRRDLRLKKDFVSHFCDAKASDEKQTKQKLNLFQRDGKRFHNVLLILTLLILLSVFRYVRMDIEPTNTLHQRNCRELDIARSPHVGLEII